MTLIRLNGNLRPGVVTMIALPALLARRTRSDRGLSNVRASDSGCTARLIEDMLTLRLSADQSGMLSKALRHGSGER